jgi:hypothetical protein
MGKIDVTEEVVDDPDLRAAMLFDPYDWRDMADRIEWGVMNRAELLRKQRPLYERLATRTQEHVVDDHVLILRQMTSNAGNSAEAQ